MASLEVHKRDCLRFLGADFEEVHKWLDEFSPAYGPEHRKFRHHQEGIEEVRQLFGDSAAASATVHILRDCRNIPKERDYLTGVVDPLGLRKEWPAAAYARYEEEAFSALVQFKLHGPTGILLWAFGANEGEVAALLGSVTTLNGEEIKETLSKWRGAADHARGLPPLSAIEGERPSPTAEVKAYFDRLREQPLFTSLRSQYETCEFTYAPTDMLISPLVLADYEYVEELRAELQGDDELSLARFAVPEKISVPVRMSVDPVGRSATVVSGQKTLMLGGLATQQIPGGGLEIKFLVTNAATMIIVSKVGERLYLRSGIHRAFMLASMGKKEIPCLMVREKQVTPLVGGYPAFGPNVLTQPRPPLLKDLFDESLALTVPLQRTNKVIRIFAEEFLVPVD